MTTTPASMESSPLSVDERASLLPGVVPEEYGTTEAHFQQDDAVYQRFSPARKRAIVALLSASGLLPFFVSGSFVPSIPEVAREFDSTGPVINLAVSLSILCESIGTIVWATYAGFYGRRPIYLSSLPIFALASLGVSFAHSVPQLLTWRIAQAFGVGGALSVGAAVIGDIYKLEERGQAMGVFFGCCLIGPAIAPLAGGLAAHYASWRFMQFAFFVVGLALVACMYAWLPETSHPHARGIDKLHAQGAKQARWVWVNPFGGVALLKSPNVLGLCLVTSAVLTTDYVLLIPLSYTIGARYGITNEAIIGALFLPSGLGNMISAPLFGRISDRIVVTMRKRRGGVWLPEDRLRGGYLSALLIVPTSVLLCGFATRYVGGAPGIILNVIGLLLNGIGVVGVLSPSSTYYVDIAHTQSAEITAVTSALRGALIALATAAALPLINTVGFLETTALSAALAWLGAAGMWVIIGHGDRMRAWVDIGYTASG
ncbi:MFS general substrate transporter [Auriscalpium vulgare]|uniref:MFS general substrate transporter n=1 Tax=Auriscalpium vulgare TaxID=40419 RepID=A0ACB8RRM9_9AGAM|nr:MFS general substrate transporter [Auriscalpium vulgare]